MKKLWRALPLLLILTSYAGVVRWECDETELDRVPDHAHRV